MNILIAIDSFKGSLSSVRAASAAAEGALRACPGAQIRSVPIADGGEGTVEALVTACNGEIRTARVSGPLGTLVDASYGVICGDTAVIEMAAASGLVLVPQEKRDPRVTSTYGTGELIRRALDDGCRKIILGIGGSATNDGGQGMLRALGVRFLDASGSPVPEGGAGLSSLASIDVSGLDSRLAECTVRVACDVDNPLCGERGASAVFGPQKGAGPAMVRELDEALSHYADIAADGEDLRDVPGAGAAGGMGFACRRFLRAEMTGGIGLMLDTAGFDGLIPWADLVITGEGATDFQTAYGKAPVGVAQRAAAHGKPVFLIAGTLGRGYEAVYEKGITAAFSICSRPMALETAISDAYPLLADAAERLVRTVCAFRK